MRILAPALKLLTVLALVGGMMWCCSENNRLRRWGRLQTGKLEHARQDLAAAGARITELENEVVAERTRRQGITELVEAAAKKAERQWDRINSKIASVRKPMPEGLRRSLAALNECLREDGYVGMRFMAAAGISDKTLLEAEMYDRDPNRLGSDLYLADQVTFLLNRENGKLTMWFRKGTIRKDGQRLTIPAGGYPVTLPQVLGPMWERRLPFLVNAEGDYPERNGKRARPEPLDRVSRGDWLMRLDQLTRRAKTNLQYRVDRFRGLEDATFKEVLLLGYDKRKCLAESAAVAELQVVVDKDRGTVELLLRNGLLRRKAGETRIGADGYHVLLLGVTPKEATDSMLGMVVQR